MRTLEEIDRDIAIAREDARRMRHFSPALEDDIDELYDERDAAVKAMEGLKQYDVARYLAAQASWANDYYKQPGSDDIGSLYDRYTLMLYVDDGYKNFDLYGAKAKNANSIHWNK